MTNKDCRFISLAVASVALPPGREGTLPAATQLAAIAMLIAERDTSGAWDFTLEHRAVAAGDGEDRLLAWAVTVMPEDGIVLGWQLAERIVPPLLEAATAGDPEIGRAFLQRLTRLVTAPSVDLAARHGGVGAPPLEAIAATQDIELQPVSAAEIQTAWSFGDRRLLRRHVAAEAAAVWRLWLAEANGAAPDASAAFDAWRGR